MCYTSVIRVLQMCSKRVRSVVVLRTWWYMSNRRESPAAECLSVEPKMDAMLCSVGAMLCSGVLSYALACYASVRE